MRGQKKSCFEAPVFYELLLPRPAPQPEPKERRGGRERVRGGGQHGVRGAERGAGVGMEWRRGGVGHLCASKELPTRPPLVGSSGDSFLEEVQSLS